MPYLCDVNILVIAATREELDPLQEIWFRKHKVHFLCSGIGMTATAHSLTRELLTSHYDLVVNTGLAGSFDPDISIGEVVRVTEDIFSELGAEDGDELLRLEEIGLEGTDILLNLDEIQLPLISQLRRVRSITVNTVHGNTASIQKVLKRLQPQTESMEGAAVFYVCGKENIPCLQIRAISNYVEKRNKDNWNIPLALKNLRLSLAGILEEM